MTNGPPSQRLRPFKPQRFGRYTLLMPLATGGMGEIFLARLEGTHGFDKLCVIKKILPHLSQDPDFVERFVNEARVLVKLSHGNVAQVLDMGVHEGAPYIALEFVDGKDLRRVLSRLRERGLALPLPLVLLTMARVLDALAYAHRKRGDDDRELEMVHRDVSPQNVLLSYEGEVKVIDFGLARSTLSSARTNPGILIGKFRYMSPEQARHQKVDRRSDLYAVGLCLYELVSGSSPFEGAPTGELMARVANPEILPLTEVAPSCPPALSDVVARALSPDPAQRFQSAEELRARLVALLHELDPEAGPELAARFMRELFAFEYHAERRMLASLREQGRALTTEDTTTEALLPPRPVDDPHATSLELSAVTTPLELPQASPPRAEALGFQPTRKGVASGPRKAASSFEAETRPAIVLADEARPPRPRDSTPTEAEFPAVRLPTPTPSAPVPWRVPEDELPPEPEPAPEATAELPFEPEPEPEARPRPARPPPVRTPSTRGRERKKSERSGERPAGRREGPRGETPTPRPSAPPTPRTPPAERAPRAETPTAPQSAAAPRKGGWLAWLVLPLLATVAVGVSIAWDLYTEDLKATQQQREGEARRAAEEREAARLAAQAQAPTAAREEDLAALPVMKDAGVPTRGSSRKAAARPVGPEAALKALRADFQRLTDDVQVRRFKLKVSVLELEKGERGAEPEYLEEVRALHAEVKAALAAQQP